VINNEPTPSVAAVLIYEAAPHVAHAKLTDAVQQERVGLAFAQQLPNSLQFDVEFTHRCPLCA
jgi:hypothetical protein